MGRRNDYDRWRKEVWDNYRRYQRDIQVVKKKRAFPKIPVSTEIPKSALLPYFEWDFESRDAFLVFARKSVRWLLRQDILVKNKRWSRTGRQNLTMLAEQLGFWKAYPDAPVVTLVVTPSASKYVAYCARSRIDGSKARWIRLPNQLRWFRPDRVDRMVYPDRSWNGLRENQEVKEFHDRVRAAASKKKSRPLT